MTVDEIETPALLVDLPAFERNLRRMAAMVAGTPVKLRPHAKAHKSPVIARQQMALGAVGVCCQKVTEAEEMVRGGITDILVTNQIVDRQKLQRLAALARTARIAVCVDDIEHVWRLNDAAAAADATIEALVEVDVGHGRCGVQPDAVLPLAEAIARSSHLRFGGLQAYHGSAQHLRSPEQRAAAIAQAVAIVARLRDRLRDQGLACERITGAGTGTFEHELGSGVYTELQAGSYAFMDADYAQNLDEAGQPIQVFEHSLFVYAAVISVAGKGHVVLDAGLKALTAESGLPRVFQRPGLKVVGVSDEHTKVAVADGAEPPRIGEKLRLIPGHIDPTVNLHDWYVCARNGAVEAVWPIAARGPGL
jgi:D-serine deaminase-like pyridoxal phosphate-dependent protein